MHQVMVRNICGDSLFIGGYETSHTRRIGPDGGYIIKIVVVVQQRDR